MDRRTLKNKRDVPASQVKFQAQESPALLLWRRGSLEIFHPLKNFGCLRISHCYILTKHVYFLQTLSTNFRPQRAATCSTILHRPVSKRSGSYTDSKQLSEGDFLASTPLRELSTEESTLTLTPLPMVRTQKETYLVEQAISASLLKGIYVGNASLDS